MATEVTHQAVTGPNDATKQVSKTVYEQDHVINKETLIDLLRTAVDEADIDAAVAVYNYSNFR